MPDIEIKRGYEVLSDNNIKFGIRVINNSDYAISDVEVILDYTESLFELSGNKVQKLGNIPPTVPRTAKFILKPLGCIHKENISATIIYKDHQWKKHTLEMHPKEVHCVCPFLKEKSIKRSEFLTLSKTGYNEERGVNFEGITIHKIIEFLLHTCDKRLYKVDEIPIENGYIIYLAADALGEKAYYLLTVVAKEYEGLVQVLLRANSDKQYGLIGFLNEILDNLRHIVTSSKAYEIGIINKGQVINIIDSIVQRSNFGGGGTDASINIIDSVAQHIEYNERKKGKEEECLREEQKERRQKEEEERAKRKKKGDEKGQSSVDIFWGVDLKPLKEKNDEEKKEQETKLSSGDYYAEFIFILCIFSLIYLSWPILNDTDSEKVTLAIEPIKLQSTLQEITNNTERDNNQTSNQTNFTNFIGMEFVQIPAGAFYMGSAEVGIFFDNEKPVHHVNFSQTFYMSKYEVTQKQWSDVMGTNPSKFKGDDLPVDQVSWDDVQLFIRKLNEKEGKIIYRLPSEAEWEYAASAGNSTRYFFGDEESMLGDYAWYSANSKGTTHPAGQKKPNGWGLYDMYGNVFEWTQDTWQPNYYQSPNDGSAWESNKGSVRVERGCAWYSPASGCRSARRARDLPYDFRQGLGFRLIMMNLPTGPIFKQLEETYLFTWDEIPGNDTLKVKDYLKNKLKADWIKNAEIKKINSERILVSFENNSLLLVLQEVNSNPEIRECGINEINAKAGNRTINIYENTITNSIGLKFIQIPSCGFDMGSPLSESGRNVNEGPIHHVNFQKTFYMGKYEVTQKQWSDIMGTNPSKFKGDDLPVDQVSWDDVQLFIRKLNEKEGTAKYRLPSEAEWELASRAGNTTRYSFGDDESMLGDYAWYSVNSNGTMHPVGQKKPNGWNLYDMYGNAFEWVQDTRHWNYDNAPVDGSSWESGGGSARVVRGCAYYSPSGGCRSARSSYDVPYEIRPGLGFRLVRDL